MRLGIRIKHVLAIEVPQADLAIATATRSHVEPLWALGECVYTVNMALQRRHKWLGKEAVELCCVECTRILARLLERMLRWVQISLDWRRVAEARWRVVVERPRERADFLLAQTHHGRRNLA